MTNEEIIEQRVFGYDNRVVGILMDLARADEREKMQGVDVWVSVDRAGDCAQMWYDNAPDLDCTGEWVGDSWNYTSFDESGIEIGYVMKNFNIQPGQCRKFKIVECVE